MNQQKIGSFLKELRKEKSMTQEELAEKLLVSSRTVSRWETGSNMPDIDLLVELAEFYEVSIPEIINGERKSENMNQEVRETALSLSDYATQINNQIKTQLLGLTLLAIVGLFGFLIIDALGLEAKGIIYAYLSDAGLGLALGMLVVLAMYLSGILGKIKAKKMMWLKARKNK